MLAPALLALLRPPGAILALAQLARLRPVRSLLSMLMVTHAGVDDATARRWSEPLRMGAVRRDLGKVLPDMHPRHTLAAATANADLPRPVLVAWGEDDRVFPSHLGRRLAADLPHAEFVTLPDCAALAALDQPALLADLITAHLAAGTGSGDAPARRSEDDRVHPGRAGGAH